MPTSVLFALGAWAAGFLDPIPDADRARTTVLLESIIRNPRGPFVGIAWFCEDGAILPPRAGACADRGGGVQHGVPSRDAKELARYGIHVGTLLAALSPDDLVAADFERARALVLEKFLEAELDGWVWRRARRYRGARQAEDEAASAERLLSALTHNEVLAFLHRPLLLQLIRALPLNDDMADAQLIRTLATQIADKDKRFQPIRASIHGAPSRSNLAEVRRYLSRAPDRSRALAQRLLSKLKAFYSPQRAAELFRLRTQRLGLASVGAQVETFRRAPPGIEKIGSAATLLNEIDGACRTEARDKRLDLLSLMAEVEARLLPTASALGRARLRREDALRAVGELAAIGRVMGLVSRREEAAAADAIRGLKHSSGEAYAFGVRRMGRLLEWIRARYVQELGAPLVRYQQVEPRTQRILDHLMRGGVTLPLARALDRLRADAEANLKLGNRVVGLEGPPFWMRGENPGFAVATLRVLRAGMDPAGLRPTDAVILEELVPKLPPVAAILTVGQPGSLSHVSILARNLGIPHVALGDEGARRLDAWVGQKVVVGVSAGHRALLARVDALSPSERTLAGVQPREKPQTFRVDVDRLRLDVQRVLEVGELTEKDAGVLVGPKAAELSRLKRLFPDRVSDAVVLPFGTFLRHVSQKMADGTDPFSRLRASLRKERDEIKILDALERFRGAIQTLPFVEGFEEEIGRALTKIGPPGTFGVFVRSDTNVEDLDAFTGAGLNLTVPNRVGLASILQAIRRVWASPFTARSYRWRQRLLENPEHVYPSVLLQRTVPSEASGVLVTTDIEGRWPNAITLSVSEGVGAVVDGGAAETVVVDASGRERLLSSSRIFAKRVVPPPPAEGVVTVPSSGQDPILDAAALKEIRDLLARITAQIPSRNGSPWDIEFGLVRGRAMLFQIRPLKQASYASTHPLLVALDADSGAPSKAVVDPRGFLRGGTP